MTPQEVKDLESNEILSWRPVDCDIECERWRDGKPTPEDYEYCHRVYGSQIELAYSRSPDDQERDWNAWLNEQTDEDFEILFAHRPDLKVRLEAIFQVGVIDEPQSKVKEDMMSLSQVRDVLRDAGRFDIYGTDKQACDLADAIDSHISKQDGSNI